MRNIVEKVGSEQEGKPIVLKIYLFIIWLHRSRCPRMKENSSFQRENSDLWLPSI